MRRVRRLFRLWRLYFLRAELRFVPSEAQRLFALTMAIGAACGLAAVGFHLAIELCERQLIGRALAAPGKSWIGWTLAAPAAGGVLCGGLLHYFPRARGSGIPEVKASFALHGGRLRFRDSAAKFAIAALQIGSGASLGREGPTVHICAGIASLLGRAARVSQKSLRRLIPVGAAAGIAAAFNAPIAAVTFTIEEIVGNLDQSVLSGVIVAAAIAAVIERSVLGEHPVFEVPPGYGLHHASSLALYLVLGIAAAAVSLLFGDALLFVRRRFRALRSVPAIARPGIGGLATGALALVAIAGLRARGITGGGYDTLSLALGGRIAVEVMIGLGLLKLAATVLSYSSGGAGGIFAPSLFIGGMLGGAIGMLDVRLLGHDPSSVGAFALVGMGAVFSGVIRAPMTSVLIIVEMTDGYSLMLPLMLANMTAYALARHFRPRPIYDALLAQDGIHLRDTALVDALEASAIAPLVRRGDGLVTLRPASGAAELLSAPAEQEAFPVLDGSGAVVGVVVREDVELLRDRPELDALINAADLMRGDVAVRLDDDLHAALDRMLANGVRRLPVIDRLGCLAGFVDEPSIAQVFLRQRALRRG